MSLDLSYLTFLYVLNYVALLKHIFKLPLIKALTTFSAGNSFSRLKYDPWITDHHFSVNYGVSLLSMSLEYINLKPQKTAFRKGMQYNLLFTNSNSALSRILFICSIYLEATKSLHKKGVYDHNPLFSTVTELHKKTLIQHGDIPHVSCARPH